MFISRTTRCVALVSVLAAGCLGDSTSDTTSAATGNQGDNTGALSGAIFTTTVDGSRVNANKYDAKSDVYLDGGPADNAPNSAAALPEGDYYFQVTDPSGHTVLSSDVIECRRVHINADGVIDIAYPGPGCQHATGIDSDHASLGAITVQLMPYADTPNNGGEYKVWITPVADIGANGEFDNNRSKTDNFKVKASEHESVCGDGHIDAGETCDDGNTVPGDGCSATCQVEMPPPPPPCVCGNGIVETGEACDDGNVYDFDGCSAICQIEPPCVCGNGIIEAGEQCDDGNTTSNDGCSASCMVEPVCDAVTMYPMRVD